ncbi:hypothetical protein ACFIJ5_10410 [Haloimpatiens sp. FM7330]|uniref:hypothetical protein n=1 Tax=Haloimpatiens sp. FM7330 TaxID=3298610 RepID=UPI00363D3ECC
MKRKFLSLVICMTTCISFTAISTVNAKEKVNTNSKQIQCSAQKMQNEDSTSQKTKEEKIYIKEIKESTPIFVGKKEIKNPPRGVRGILSEKISRNFNSIIKFFEKNKDIFRIEDPKNQLKLLRDSGDVFRLSQVVDGIPTDNTYIVIFNDNNQIQDVHGSFDNSLYEENSSAKAPSIITKEQAFEIAKADAIMDVSNSNIPGSEKRESINILMKLRYRESLGSLHICKYDGYIKEYKGKYFKTYKFENIGWNNVYVSTTSGEIIRKAGTIYTNTMK